MFVVRSPLPFLWHPSVHHSLLLLRILGKVHTLEILPSSSTQNDLAFLPSWASRAISIEIDHAVPSRKVRQPDHILFLINNDEAIKNSSEPFSSYFGAVSVTQHIINSTELLLYSLQSSDLELIRRSHSMLLSLIEHLEETLEDNTDESELADLTPSTAALFSTLRFLIDEGGILQSAFPNISSIYSRWRNSSKLIHQHDKFFERSLSAFYQGFPDHSRSMHHPFKGFLADVHSKISTYTSSFEERISDGVVGDGGALHSRVSGGRFGVQSTHSRLPWTRQRLPLKKED